MSLQRSSIQVSLASLGVYVVSFINQLLIARVFGAGPRLDAYLAASNVPLAVNNLVGALFVFAVVPQIVHGQSDSEFAARVKGLFVGCAKLAVATILIGAGIHAVILFSQPSLEQYRVEAVVTAMISWCSCGLFFVTALSDALFNARRQFLVPVLAYLPAYVLTAFACYLLGSLLGGIALAGATLVGYLLVVPYRWSKQAAEFSVSRNDEMFRAFLQRAPYAGLAVLSLYAFPFVDTLIAPSVGPGVLSILGFSTRLVSTLAVILALGPFGVLIPEIAEHSAAGDRSRLITRSLSLVRYAFALLTPVCLWLAVNRLAIVQVLFQRGKFGPSDSQNLADLLQWTAIGSLFMIVSMLLLRIYMADNRHRTAAIISLVTLLMYGVISRLLSQGMKLQGFGIAYLEAWGMCAIVAGSLLVRQDREHVDSGVTRRFALKTILTSVTSFVAIILLAKIHVVGTLVTMAILGISLAISVFMSLAIGSLLKSHEHQRLLGIAVRLLSRSRAA